MNKYCGLQNLNNITKDLISDINYIIRHTNRGKLTKATVMKLQMMRNDLQRDLVYYNFMMKTNNNFGIDELIQDKTLYLNRVSFDVNTLKRIVQ